MSDIEIFAYDPPTGRRLDSPDHPGNYRGTVRILPLADLQASRSRGSTGPRRTLATSSGMPSEARTSTARRAPYERVSSQPLLAGDPREHGVSTFFVSDDSLVFLRPLG